MTELKMKLRPWEPPISAGKWKDFASIGINETYVGSGGDCAVLFIMDNNKMVTRWRLPNEPMPPTNGLRRIVTPRDKVIFNGGGTARIEWAETEADIKAEDLPHNAVFETENVRGEKFLWRVHNYCHDKYGREYGLLSCNAMPPDTDNVVSRKCPLVNKITRVLGILEGFEEL
jgi:hypothetical protein